MKSTSSAKKTPKKRIVKNTNRVNFPADVVKQIAYEAHLFCSNPKCCRFTSYLTTHGSARAIAEAAHINAASGGGPRAHVGISDQHLRSAANGIWLCKICHTQIDQDPDRYPEATLLRWKREHSAFVRELVGKDFDVVHFELYARSRNTAQCISFLTFIENRRVFFEALDAEFPEQVLQSLTDVRTRIGEARASMSKGTLALKNLNGMGKAIRTFLTAAPDLQNLKCDASDATFNTFMSGLQRLRTTLLPMVVEIAKDVDHELSDELINEAHRLSGVRDQ
ncbi:MULTISPECIES: HNH endonuclease [unclassified Caballeronia]|uniref:HNH endonuclease n=1 Tax=unclassified Caballeronia TaxID=2646786 RepID=UPI002028BA8D|nr:MULTISPECIES: HNH endonuclease [unclassified Caballeronia]